ncbi:MULTISPECIES: NUDIX domain-containing protein [Streptomycetaceae]|uniref:NUDIX hydrolase n=1 Tax=Streptantibioticus cattleyicolor (strain ATCC 35852 / DSM 46488 / JCM 4925 / NBRC 14057 / NRRL 8057) TaxID=1003195 RepID=F8JXD3_STREN|nr:MULTISPECIES: NUDIX hydrolase [Streptomycetaceae]AEW95813.1 NUDIX hydrolase [Streptantibioticus cattleyicolor NRRL 8057 = DSM 46488]MYS60356.1 NUDIX domain-containing protein [Streptomyces sp. SID5468]CCB76152.1 NUDIX hydrolase [Streptantibioticus cattleyicolor NRRL 8057 = DSM 46488]
MADNDHEQRMAHPRVAAGVLFFDVRSHVLLVRPSYKPLWEIPGGYVEAGESPLAACRREVREELGISPAIGDLLVVDWAPNPAEGDKILYVFDGGRLRPEEVGAIELAPDEVLAAEFHPVENVDELLIPRLGRRVKQAVAARADARPRYLEHGEPPAG